MIIKHKDTLLQFTVTRMSIRTKDVAVLSMR